MDHRRLTSLLQQQLQREPRCRRGAVCRPADVNQRLVQLLSLLEEPAAGAADDQQTQRGQQEVAAGDEGAAQAAVTTVERHQGDVAANQETNGDLSVETQHRQRAEGGDVRGEPAHGAEGRRQLAQVELHVRREVLVRRKVAGRRWSHSN